MSEYPANHNRNRISGVRSRYRTSLVFTYLTYLLTYSPLPIHSHLSLVPLRSFSIPEAEAMGRSGLWDEGWRGLWNLTAEEFCFRGKTRERHSSKILAVGQEGRAFVPCQNRHPCSCRMYMRLRFTARSRIYQSLPV